MNRPNLEFVSFRVQIDTGELSDPTAKRLAPYLHVFCIKLEAKAAYNVGGRKTMRKLNVLLAVVLVCTLAASAAKQKGTATLKDLQPAGTTDKKNKTQKYDISFDAAGNEYTCRTKDKIKATDFVVGHDVSYELDKDKVKLKNPSGEEAKCSVVRVEKMTGAPRAEAPK